jgi:hypothetical protein
MKKILTIDGGSTRGIMPAIILSAIEEHTGIPIRNKDDKVIQQMRALAISRFRSEKKKILDFLDVATNNKKAF